MYYSMGWSFFFLTFGKGLTQEKYIVDKKTVGEPILTYLDVPERRV
jgi:hypothetical protein